MWAIALIMLIRIYDDLVLLKSKAIIKNAGIPPESDSNPAVSPLVKATKSDFITVKIKADGIFIIRAAVMITTLDKPILTPKPDIGKNKDIRLSIVVKATAKANITPITEA